ncbi:MAG: type II secretion system F family protein [bacterium]
MSANLILVLILVFSALGILLVLFSLKRREKKKKLTLKEKIRPYVDQAYREQLARQKSAEAEAAGTTFLRGVADKVSDVALSDEIQQYLQNWLLRGGLKVRPAEFLIVCLVVMVVFGAVLGLLATVFIGGRAASLGLIGFALGWVFPIVYVLFRRKQRMAKFNSQLLDLVTLMSNSLKSGYGFLQALNLIAAEAASPASEEFGRVIQENKYGVSIDDALTRLVERMDSEDLDLLVTAVLIQRQVGGNLSEILDQISSTIRERLVLKGQIKALTAQGKLGGAIISFLPVALGLVFYMLQPEMMTNFVTHPFGLGSIGLGIFWQSIGIFIIWQIVNIEV